MSATLINKESDFLKKPGTNNTFIVTAEQINVLVNTWKISHPGIIVKRLISEVNTVIIECSNQLFFNTILKDPNILFADVYVKPSSEVILIGYDRSQNGIQVIHELIPSANGRGITIGIKETNVDDADIDLRRRIIPSTLADRDKDPHATVVASIAGGAGNSFITGKGLAWGAQFYSSTFNNLFPDNANILLQNNVSVQNHSYGTIKQNFYGAEAMAYDGQIYNDANHLMHVFSSGNRGQDSATGGTYRGIAGFSNLTGNFKMAKNITTVGATDSGENIIQFSSTGPLYDGRLAPQIMALGPNGTSDAAAVVSGAAALLQQLYKDSNNQQLPPASLVKALLFTTATDVGQKGIDYKSGFGAVNAYKAAKALQQKHFVNGVVGNNEMFSQNLSLPNNAINVKFTLVWSDTAARINSSKALVNDLDFVVKELNSGIEFQPWVLSSFPSADSLNKLPVRRKDTLNTCEQITIDLPTGNNYTLMVRGSKIMTINREAFSIAYTFDTINHFQFTHPLNASDIDRNENEQVKIKWDVATLSAAERGNLSVSYNNGTSWTAIQNQVMLNNKKLNWQLPDTATTAILRMQTSFGIFVSRPFIIAPLTKLNVGYFCAEETQLSWKKHIYASSYQVFSQADSAYLKPLFTTIDTTAVIPKSINASNIFAVQPILQNGLYATRSAAIDVRKQGVLCYYKTLLAIDIAGKVNLLLSLSLPSATDSIVFEKLNANGTLIRKVATIRTNTLQNELSAFDNNPVAGANYYRAVIYLKTGKIIFTETVMTFSNANENVFVYPNPVKEGQAFNFLVNNFVTGNTLQLLDAKGSIIKNVIIGQAGKIATTGLKQGLYFYRITKPDGTTFASGKIIITQ